MIPTPSWAPYTLPGLWHCFEWVLAKSILGVEDLQKCTRVGCKALAMFVLIFCERGPGVGDRLEGTFLQGNMWTDHTVSKLGSECQHCTGSCRWPCVYAGG